MKAWLVRIVALIVFGVSFALPAIRMGTGASPQNQMAGWMCAVVASITAPKAMVQSLGQGVRIEEYLITVSGLINYLFLAILVLSFWRRLVRTRLVLGAIMDACIIATWIFFASSKITPLAGHYVWIAGAILIVVPDFANLFTKQHAVAASHADRIEAGR